jgi:prepilin-type N-terminal cleavage/methylation domain-containing protein
LKGFTLLELLVVVALISLLALLVPPALFNDTTRQFNKAVDSALMTLRRARLEAVMEKKSRTVAFPRGRPETDDEESWYRDGIEVDLSGYDEQPQTVKVSFFPDGSSTGGALIFKENRLRRRILIRPQSGRVSIERE